jgi:hypothetical protein
MSAAATDATLRIYLLRDTTDIAFFDLRVDSGSDGPDVSRHVGSFFVLDRPSAGTYTYKCEAIRDLTAGAGSATISFYLSPLFIAKEFIF